MDYPSDLITTIADGKYAVIPTDTIYGIVGSALNKTVVEKLYEVRKRDSAKPFIVLIGDMEQLTLFAIPLEKYTNTLNRYWPGPVSIILPCPDERFEYLHRGTGAIAFRLPAHEMLRELIRTTGPIVAPSANPEGAPPATAIEEAKEYFGNQVFCYVDGGTVTGAPSAIISIDETGVVTKIRN